MNYISFSFKNITDKQIENCENILMLRYYLVDGKKIYKIPIMPHNVRSIKEFVKTILDSTK